MCLAVPMQVTAIAGQEAVVTQGGTELRVRTDLLDSVRVSDYVLVHAGFALQVIDEEEAKQTLMLLQQMMDGDPPSPARSSEKGGEEPDATGG